MLLDSLKIIVLLKSRSKMRQQTNIAAVSSCLFICSVLSLSCGSTLPVLQLPSIFSTSFAGRPRPSIISTATGTSELFTSQESNADQTLSFEANGTGMVIDLSSTVSSDSSFTLAQNGGISGPSSADVNHSLAESGITPESAIQLSLVGTESVSLELDSHTFGWELVDATVEQQAQVFTDQINKGAVVGEA